MSNKEQPNVNRQNHPHQEGQQNNTVSENLSAFNKENNSQPMSNMLNESEEQKAGRAHDQEDESKVQQGERTP